VGGARKKILFIGELDPHARTYQRKRAFEELGHIVSSYSTLPVDATLDGTKSLFSRLSWKAGLPYDSTRINKSILREVTRQHPDVLWIEKGNTVYPWTLQAVRKISPNTKIISYVEDDMFALHNRSWYFTCGLKHYTCMFTTKSYNCNPDELPRLGAVRVVFVNNAYDIRSHSPVAVTTAEIEALGADVGFIGTYETERAKSIAHLAAHGVTVRVWGNGWHVMTGSHPNLKIEDRAIYGNDYTKAICATKINLCFLRKANRDRQTTRSIEIPACGGFMLAERTEEHLALFKEGVEAEYFGSDSELLDKVKHYLADEQKRHKIAENGRRRCVSGKYDHHSLLLRALHEIGALT
jgi:spore maturation protein CgeB